MRIKDYWFGFWAWWSLRPRKSAPVTSHGRFRNVGEVSAYVDRELTAALPNDWAYQRNTDLEWVIAPKTRPPDSQEDDYRLEVSGDFRTFILYFGNSSAGCDYIDTLMLTAVVLRSGSLASRSLGFAVTRMIENRDQYRLNMWTLT